MFLRIALRLGRLVLTTLAVVVVVFALLRVVPGDPVAMILGDWASPADAEGLRHALGLDAPWPVALRDYLYGLLRGDWGVSLVKGQPVLHLLAERLPATAWLGFAAMGVAVAWGIPAGILMGLQDDGVTGLQGYRITGLRGLGGVSLRGLDFLVTAVMATPTFVLGPLLILLGAVALGWFPVSGRDEGLVSLVLPALTLGLGMGAVLARLLAATLRGERAKAYGLTVAAKGGGRRVQLKHWLRNALGPVVLVFCLQLGMVLTGTVLTEAVFGWPGIGNLLVEALNTRDYPVVQGCLILISVGYGLAVLLADVLQGILDPRLRSRG